MFADHTFRPTRYNKERCKHCGMTRINRAHEFADMISCKQATQYTKWDIIIPIFLLLLIIVATILLLTVREPEKQKESRSNALVETGILISEFQGPDAPTPIVLPTPTTITPTTTTATAFNVWDELADCEASGDWQHPPVSSYGYSGGLMFLPSTWTSYGGTEFAAQAHHATREQQIIVAERILEDHDGTFKKGWPGCRSELGLP